MPTYPSECRYCRGQGCLFCPTLEEQQSARRATMPTELPEPLLTVQLDAEGHLDAEGLALLAETVGADKIAADYGPGGGGVFATKRRIAEALARREPLAPEAAAEAAAAPPEAAPSLLPAHWTAEDRAAFGVVFRSIGDAFRPFTDEELERHRRGY